MRSNPNGANGITGDPREQICWDLYVQSIMKNEESAHQAALKAGYSPDHARNITLQGWFKERRSKLKRKEMLSKAERNLEKMLDTNYEKETENGIEIKSDVMRIVADVSKTIVSTLGKDEGYSTRTELTAKDGEHLIPRNEVEETLEALKREAGLYVEQTTHTGNDTSLGEQEVQGTEIMV